MTEGHPDVSPTHRAREAAQVALGIDDVEAADVHADSHEGTYLELTVWGGSVPTAVMDVLVSFGCALDPDKTATRGDPTHTVVVARP